MVNIIGALKTIKQMQNELKRKIRLREDNFNLIIPKELTIQEYKKKCLEENIKIVDFHKISEEINELLNNIIDLREKLLKTNINTIIEFNGKKISSAKLKLQIDNIRSELSHFENINEEYSYKKKLRKVDEEEKKINQVSDLELENIVIELEKKKISMENKLETSNATTELLE